MTAAIFSKFKTSYNGKVMALIMPSSYLRLEVMFDLLRYMTASCMMSVQPVNLKVNNQNHFQKASKNKMTLFMSEEILED